MIVKYSLINSMTNPTPLYSVMNPLTNSEGLSEKSKGRRLLSASIKTNTKTNKGNKTTTPGTKRLTINCFNLTLFKRNTMESKKNLKHSS